MDGRRPVYKSSECPPGPRLPFRPVLKVEPARLVKVVILSERVIGFCVHFDRDAKLSFPHAYEGTCRGCEMGLGMRWTGYAAGLENAMANRPCLVPFPASCYRGAKDRGIDVDNLRGCVLEFRRKTAAKNSPLIACQAGKVSDMRTIPKAFDVQEALMRLWGVDHHIASYDDVTNGDTVYPPE